MIILMEHYVEWAVITLSLPLLCTLALHLASPFVADHSLHCDPEQQVQYNGTWNPS